MKFEIGDRVRQFFPHTGYLTGRVVREANEDGVAVWQEDTTGKRFPTCRLTANLSKGDK